MIDFPSTNDPAYGAFIIGFFLPFISALSGFIIALVRHLLSHINQDRL